MQISKEQIEAVKQSNDLLNVIKSRGIKLKKKGKNYVGLCPFHNEKTPSFTVDPVKQLYNCFGCPSNGNDSTGGDVIGFVVRFDKVSFPEAVKRLSNGFSAVGKRIEGLKDRRIKGEGKKQESEAGSQELEEKNLKSEIKNLKSLTPNLQKLLNRVIQYYQGALFKDTRGLDYLHQERGIRERQSIIDFGAGFAAGNLLETLPSEGEVIDNLKAIGILNNKGHELFYGSVVFPLLDYNNNVVSIYGRRIETGGKGQGAGVKKGKNNTLQIKHLYLPGKKQGLVNRQAAKRSKTLILTESVIDALSLYDAGFKNVIPCYGTNGLTDDHLSLFSRHNTEEIYICFDSDVIGKEASARTAEQLKEKDITVYQIGLPEKDANDYLKRHTPEEFEKLLKAANPSSLVRSAIVSKRQETLYKQTDTGFSLGLGDRRYEVKGFSKQGTQLKATIKAFKASDNNDGIPRFELTTIDLYSTRSRNWFASLCSGLLGEVEELIREDMDRLLEKIENLGNAAKTEEKKITITEEQKAEAMRFLKNPDMFKEILHDLETLGTTGEEMNKLLCYITALSRKMEDPLSVLIRSRSAAGKSTLQDAILSLVPEEDYIKYTRITDQALYYKEEDALVHRILAVEETAGMNGASYSIRAIQSNKNLTIASTSKDPVSGRMKTEEYKVKGPVSIFLTTTEVNIDEEMESRFLTVTIDESKEMTRKIHDTQRYQDTIEGYLLKRQTDKIITKHHNAQRLLQPLAVINPYSKYLNYPDDTLGTRRDNRKYLNLIRAITFLHQYQRKHKKINHDSEVIEYIEVTLDDIAIANKIAAQVLGQSIDDLTPPARRLLLLIHKMVEDVCKEKKINPSDYIFSRREIREYTKWSDWQIRTHLKELEDMEYLRSRQGSWGKEYSYELRVTGDLNKKIYMGLTSIEEIKRKIKK